MSCDACTSAVCICWDEPPACKSGCDCEDCCAPPLEWGTAATTQLSGGIAWYGTDFFAIFNEPPRLATHVTCQCGMRLSLDNYGQEVADHRKTGCGRMLNYGWPAAELCKDCGVYKPMGKPCNACGGGRARCPYSLGKPAGEHDAKCAACKGSCWVEELT